MECRERGATGVLQRGEVRWGRGLLGMLKQRLHGGEQEWDPSLCLFLFAGFLRRWRWKKAAVHGQPDVRPFSLSLNVFSLSLSLPKVGGGASLWEAGDERPVVCWCESVKIGDGDGRRRSLAVVEVYGPKVFAPMLLIRGRRERPRITKRSVSWMTAKC